MRRLAWLVPAGVAACGGGSGSTMPPPPPPPAPVAAVTVTLSPAVVNLSGGAQAVATLRDAGGNTLTGRTVTWNSSNPGVATIAGNGAITTVTAGVTTITATSEGINGSAQLTVNPPPVASVTVTLANATLVPGATTTATATPRGANGTALTGRTISWSSSNTAIASVAANGIVTAVAQGNVQITATSEGISGSAPLTVTAPPVATVQIFGTQRVKVGDLYQYTVEARLSDGTLVQRPVTWAIAEAGRATINASGMLLPLVTGTITLQATVDGITASGTLTGYDWVFSNTGTAIGLTLAADLTVTNKFGTAAYPALIIACSNTGTFAVGVFLSNMVTAHGGVSYFFDNSAIISDTWVEGSSFDLLIWPGLSNLSHKNFANLLALASRFGFAFNEFQAGAHATVFRTTGLTPLLTPLLTGCPSNLLREGEPVVESPADILRRFLPEAASRPDRRLRETAGMSMMDGSRTAIAEARREPAAVRVQ